MPSFQEIILALHTMFGANSMKCPHGHTMAELSHQKSILICIFLCVQARSATGKSYSKYSAIHSLSNYVDRRWVIDKGVPNKLASDLTNIVKVD